MRICLVVSVLLLCSCDSDPPCIPQKIEEPGHPPVLSAQSDTSAAVGDTLWLQASASDPDGDVVTYYATAILRDASEQDYVADLQMNPDTGEFWFVPRFQDMPARTIMFTAADEHGYSASVLFDVSAWYHVDQKNDAATTGGHNVILYYPIGQEFVPDLSALDVVQLWLIGGWSYSGPAEFRVNIRAGTVGGELLAASDVTALPERFAGVASFEFERIALTPGQTYVIELVQLSGHNWLVGTTQSNPYVDGRMILKGQPVETMDLWFREGAVAPLP